MMSIGPAGGLDDVGKTFLEMGGYGLEGTAAGEASYRPEEEDFVGVGRGRRERIVLDSVVVVIVKGVSEGGTQDMIRESRDILHRGVVSIDVGNVLVVGKGRWIDRRVGFYRSGGVLSTDIRVVIIIGRGIRRITGRTVGIETHASGSRKERGCQSHDGRGGRSGGIFWRMLVSSSQT